MSLQRDSDRYIRQTVMPEIGPEGQRTLKRSKAVVVGCGALGSTIAEKVVRAGVGHVRLLDRDVVELSNMQRQSLFDEDDVAARRPKAEAARLKLARINTEVRLEAEVAEVSADNVEQLVRDADVVLDGTDNFETRFLLNDACVKLGLPWVYGGVVGVEGMLLTVIPGRSACLRCVFSELPAPGSIPGPEERGVLNTSPAVVAALEATEAYKILLGAEPLDGLLRLDLWSGSFETIRVRRAPSCPTCGRRDFEFLRGS